MPGYSGTPLAKKLGIKPAHRVALVNAPTDFERTLDALPDDVTMARAIRGSRPIDVIIFFPKNAADLDDRFPTLAARLPKAGGLWIAWPKKASKIPTDLSDDVVRTTGLAHKLVDNKVCAISDTHSGLRFVYRLKDR
jgi:hypothetical protein